ncbi:testis-specific serine/threonine-protein kinase 3-like [Sycon ciliatum]|uniref:testis-specific serine/threonine-protein kinase 3-like n=1 Tax=Sycon ciliatum TaxID=27933 RepID=UPI0020AB50B2|eukprot:scpid93317/ scgid31744/ Testis-specific serine/threonine-protein kinase 3; Serine/threonine-protein kinase 22C
MAIVVDKLEALPPKGDDFCLDVRKDVVNIVNLKNVLSRLRILPNSTGSTARCAAVQFKDSKQQVALKMFKQCDEETGHRFMEEARIAVKVSDHPNVITTSLPLYRSEKEGFIMVIELANGGDLWDYVFQSKPKPEYELRGLSRQMVDGLSHVHGCGYAHMDVKLENFVVFVNADNSKTLKLIDFGLAYGLGRWQDRVEMDCSGAAYYAPERFPLQPPLYSPQEAYFCVQTSFDVWGLGICLVVMFTLQYPWDRADITKDIRYAKFQEWASHFRYGDASRESAPEIFQCFSDAWLDIFVSIFDEIEETRLTMAQLRSAIDRPDSIYD